MSELLAIFPLQLVLFPETPLPLHIFEARYREMVAECMKFKKPFGIVRDTEQEMAAVGCTAEIIEITKRYDDGRLDIMTVGQRRFHVIRVEQGQPLLRAEVNYFDDEASNALATERARAMELQRELAALAGEKLEDLAEDHPQLSFQLAAPVPLDLDFKQALLAMRSERERLTALIGYYEAMLPKLRRTIKAQRKAGGNWHVVN